MDQKNEKNYNQLKTLLSIAKEGEVIVRAEYYTKPQEAGKANSLHTNTMIDEMIDSSLRIGAIPDEVIKGILKVRDTGDTNMFDIKAVQAVANRLGEYDLVNFLEDKSNLTTYGDFIVSGDKSIPLRPCATVTFYGTEKFRSQMIQKLFPDKK